MILKKISVKNFKCFSDCSLEFSKLNVFTGANSSGKSSILDAILTTAQSHQTFPYQLSPNGKYVVMGDYYEFVRNHDLTKPIEISATFQDDNKFTTFNTIWTRDESTNMPTIGSLEAKSDFIHLSISKNHNYKVHIHFNEEAFKKSDSYKNAKLLTEFLNQITHGEINKNLNKRLGNIDIKIFNNDIDFQIKDLDDISGVLTINKQQLVEYALVPILRYIQNFKSRFNYISSFRVKPERTYTQRSQSQVVAPNGENTIDQIFRWKAIKSPKFNQLLKELRGLNLMNTLNINHFRGGRYEIRVRTKIHSAWASLVDVGFGISQFLPVIVSDLQLPKRSTLMIDQPEIHLHPSAQSQLADYFIRQIKDNDKNYFIETHSEYLLNRLRAAIVKGKLNPSNIKVFYFENNGDEIIISKIRFTKNGRILGAPKGFFDTYMIDVMDIAIGAASNK
jgi:predicted ATPase